MMELKPKSLLSRIIFQFFSPIVCAALCLQALAQTPPPVESLLEYAGIYKLGDYHEIGISVRRMGKMGILLLSDFQTDEVRALFPQSKDRFIAGRELRQAMPIQYHIAFKRKAGAEITSFAMRVEGHKTEQIALRQPQRVVPLKFSQGGATLLGDLHLPVRAPRSYPLVVLAHGSEENDRYNFDALPYLLTQRGVAVFTYDKRGTGQSTGSWETAGLELLADDLLAAVTMLKTRKDINAQKIGIIGFSEGGWIAPLAASKAPDIRLIVSISGGAFTKGVSFVHKYRQQFLEQGLSGEALEKALAEKEAIISESAERVRQNRRPSGFDQRVTYDPAPHWRAFKGSVLYLVGENDALEPAEKSAVRLRELLSEAGHPDFTIKVFPRAHHGLFLGISGKPSEFASLNGIRQLAPGYWDTLLRWIEVRFGL